MPGENIPIRPASGISRNQVVLVSASLAILILALGVYLGLKRLTPVAHGFAGVVEKVQGDVIFARGHLVLNGVALRSAAEDGDEVQIVVTPETTITRTARQLPEGKGDIATTTRVWGPEDAWKPSDVIEISGSGSLEEISSAENLLIDVVSENEITPGGRFKAKTISYIIDSFRKLPDKIPPQ